MSEITISNHVMCGRKRKRDEMNDPNKTLKKKIKLSSEVLYPSHIDADDLEVIQQGSVNILTHKRVRKESKHKDDSYFQEVNKHKKSCSKNGGFVKGSGYHYDREF